MPDFQLNETDLQAYDDNGYIILRQVFDQAECDSAIAHYMDLHAGRKNAEWFTPRKPDEWGRTMNLHFHDPVAMNLLLDSRLRRPLEQCFRDQVDGVQTMYFYKGSEQRRHQDAYYLPDCMSAWIAMADVGPDNGTIWVQPGSQNRKLLTKADFSHLLKTPDANPVSIGAAYNDEVDRLFDANALPEEPVIAKAGDVVLFSGSLIHRGGPIGVPSSFRHVMACHYLPYSSTAWPYPGWKRYSFDGEVRDTAAA